MHWTEEHLRSAVTDSATLKRGQQLAVPSLWKELAHSDRGWWGLCQGSGSKPYQVVMDNSGPAFKCSCPSRTFPCKHGAGLMALIIADRALFQRATEPEWVDAWLNKRLDKRPSVDTPATSAQAASDPEAQARREAKRNERMAEGLVDLDRWLVDAVRTGLASLQSRSGSFQEEQAARLVDAQLPGLAARLRAMNIFQPGKLLNELGELYLLVSVARRADQLPLDAHEEVAQLLGVNLKKETVIANGKGIADQWWVLGQVTTVEDRLTQRRIWFMGRNSGRYALMIDHSFGTQGFSSTFILNAIYEGEMFFFPGLHPLRATAQELHLRPEVPHWDRPAKGPLATLDEHADALARDPWLRRSPVTLSQVVPEFHHNEWYLRHDDGLLRMQCSDDEGWNFAAQCGGHPVDVFGEWDGHALTPIQLRLEPSAA